MRDQSIMMDIEQTSSIRGRIWHLQVMPMLRNSYDLLLLMGLAVLLPGLWLLPLPLRVPLGLALALIAPGYALAAALFPRRDDLDGAARAAVSFGLSVAVLPLLALALSWLPWGIQPLPITISLSVWILLFSNIALWARRFLASTGTAYTPPAMQPLAGWHNLSERVKMRYAIGVLVLGALLTTGAILLLQPDPTAQTTEFYILGKGDLAENYPREVTPGQELTTTIGIVNRKAGEAAYRVQVWVGAAWNSERRTLVAERGPFIVSPDNKVELPISWHMPWVADDQKVEFLLFTGGQTEPYRRLWLWLNVVE
jgi:uncharacterized membrane protein